jgi:TetR/AcrR family transcriptional regulator, fatty acid metabolism regulator protein
MGMIWMAQDRTRVAASDGEGKRGERRASILRAARQLFIANGAARTTMAEIARAIGVAEGTVYLYFASKQDLVAAVAGDWFEEITEATVREAQAIHEPTDRLRFLIQRHLSVILDNRELYLTFIREVRASETYGASSGRAVNRRYTGLLRDVLQQATESGLVACGLDASTMRDLVYGGAEHVAWSAIVRGDSATLDKAEAANSIAAMFVRGFGLQPTSGADHEERLRRIEDQLGL